LLSIRLAFRVKEKGEWKGWKSEKGNGSEKGECEEKKGLEGREENWSSSKKKKKEKGGEGKV